MGLVIVKETAVTGLPLLQRKRRLVRILPKVESRVLYLDHIAERGSELFRAACKRDLEGVVAKWARGTYQTDGLCTSWIKIKNPGHSQREGRHGLFASRRRVVAFTEYRCGPNCGCSNL